MHHQDTHTDWKEEEEGKKTQLQVTWQKLCTLMLVCISNRNRTNGLDKNEEGAWKIYIQILIYSN